MYRCVAIPVDPCEPLADLTTAIPSGDGSFTGFGSVSTTLGHTAFLGFGSGGQAGIYLASALTKVIAVGDVLDDKVVSALSLGRSGFIGSTLAFTAIFNDGSEGVYVARVGTYPFAGFFAPVDNLPVLNQVQAGRTIPVRFSLGGNRGLSIFAAGYPKSTLIPCDSAAIVDGVEETVNAGASSLSYNAGSNVYTFAWKTEQAWSKTCRQLVLKLKDDSTHVANFTFR